jgi:hypothetical protein
MFSQVTKTSAISKHAIHCETFLEFFALLPLRYFFSAEDLELRPYLCCEDLSPLAPLTSPP